MRTHSRWITVGVAAGLLALAGASLLHAQQPQQQPRDTARETGAVMPTDTLNRQGARTDTAMQKPGAGGYRYNGPATDTTLKGKPGLQTGRARADSSAMPPDTAATRIGNVHRRGAAGYRYTGAASDTALHARPGTQTGKSPADSGKANKKARHHQRAAASDSAKSDSVRTGSH